MTITIGQLITRYLNHIGFNVLFDTENIFSVQQYNIVNINANKRNEIYNEDGDVYEYVSDFSVILNFKNGRIPGIDLQVEIDFIDNVFVYYTHGNIDTVIEMSDFVDFVASMYPEYVTLVIEEFSYFLDHSITRTCWPSPPGCLRL